VDGSQWTKCPACGAFIYRKRLERSLNVCPECSHHFRLQMEDRLSLLLDEGSFIELGEDIEPVDVLQFKDSKPYPARLEEAQRATGRREGVVYGMATISGHPVILAAMDFGFIGGSLGGAEGEAITRAAELATRTRTPLLAISASGGARMQEGSVSLVQLAKTSQAIARVHEAGILYISLLTDPTTGGVTASFATLGDLLIAEPNTLIAFAGPRVIEQTIRQTLPEGFQTAEFLLERGMLDIVEPREGLRHLIGKILRFHARAAGDLPALAGRMPVTDPDALPRRPAPEVVQLARNTQRPTMLQYIDHVFDDFLELHGDRLFGDDPAIVGGLARLGDRTVVVVGHQKGRTPGELMERNFGMAHPEGYRKAMRLMRYAAKFGMPIVTLVDTPGAYPGVGAEERGQAMAIARSIMEMGRLPVPIVSVITGEGASGGAIALAVGDRVLMMENAWYGVISPEGCSSILFKTRAQAARAAELLRLTAPDLLRLSIVDAVVPEPEGGAHVDLRASAANLKTALVASLRELVDIPSEDLIQSRYERFRDLGTPGRQPLLAG
jgi:acetyl-CoA carboxylase carboxyl transferase subunit beta